MAVLLLVGTLTFAGVLPFPFNKGFSRPAAETVLVPCPVEDASAADASTITVRIFNGNGTEGLASSVSSALTNTGVVVSETTNWAGAEVKDAVRIYTGKAGITNAYTLRSYFPDATIVFDGTNATAVVEVVLGAEYKSMVAKPTEAQRTAAMEPLPKCEDAE